MNPPFRCKQEVIINAPLETVWEFGIDLTRIPAIVTVLPEDTFGISKILPHYVVETTFPRVGESSAKIGISHYLKRLLANQPSLFPSGL